MRRDEHESVILLEALDDATLERVTGGADPSFGRCGPGASWGFLGNVYTPECRAHDTAVRGAIQSGSSKPVAHLRALPLLPAAIGSYARRVVGR
jgi:hypothetical protein